MIPRTRKFPLRTEFLTFRRRAHRTVTPHATYYMLHATKHSRLAVVVPKKLSKLATTRNWLKRTTYDTLWPLIKDQKIDCVVVYKPSLPAHSLGGGGPLKKSPATKEQIISELNSTFINLKS